MWKAKRLQLFLVAASVMLPVLVQAAPEFTGQSRSENNLPVEYQLKAPASGTSNPWKFNKQDCEDGVVFTVRSSATDLGDKRLYLFRGTNCKEGINCDDKRTKVDFSGAENSFTVKELAGGGCSGQGNTQIWLGMFDALENKAAGLWATPIDIEWDMTPPLPPTEVKAIGGDRKVTITWSPPGSASADKSSTDSDEVEASGAGSSYYVVYWKAGDASSAESDSNGSDADTDDTVVEDQTDNGSSLEDTADTEDTNGTVDTETAPKDTLTETETGVDSGTQDSSSESESDVPGGPWPRAAMTCPAGGMDRGDEFDPDFFSSENGYGIETGMSSGSSVRKLENGAIYKVAVVTRDDFMNFSILSGVACAIPEETTGFFDEFSNDGGELNGKLCFVATVAFGSQDHPTVDTLRIFRDEFLLSVPGGGAFVDAYYTIGPFVAKGLAQFPALHGFVRGLLSVLALLGSVLVFLGPLGFASVMALGLVGLGGARRRRTSQRRPS
jgi:hypothetical protein